MTISEPASFRKAWSIGALQSVPVATVAGWLAIFAFYEFLRAESGAGGIPFDILHLTQKISALACLEIFFIIRLLNWNDRQHRLGPIEAAAILAGLAGGIFLVDKPFVLSSLLSVFLFVRFVWTPQVRWFVIALFIFFAQYNPVFINGTEVLHIAFADIDANVVRTALNLAGYHVTGTGSVIYDPSGSFGVDIQKGCASTSPLMQVLPGFMITVIGLRGYMLKSDLAFLLGVVAATICVNQIRLALTALGYDNFLYWHEGDGKAIISAIYPVVAFAGGYLATRWSKQTQAAT